MHLPTLTVGYPRPPRWPRRCVARLLPLLAGSATLALHGQTIILEAETATLVGTQVSTSARGYSGTGYVTGFDAAGDLVRWDFAGTAGLYDLMIVFRSPFGPKGFGGSLNGFGWSGTFPATTSFATLDAGLVEVVAGANTLEMGGGWNWYEIDRVDLVPAPVPSPPSPVPATPVDSQATYAARALLQQLASDYGTRTWSGQHGTAEVAVVENLSGRKPVIVSGDLIDYSPSRVAYQGAPADHTERMIALEDAGHVLAFCWHWNAPDHLLDTPEQPWWRGFYTEATTFDLAAAIADPLSTDSNLLLRDIDAIADQLSKAAARNIPVLWRPLHESEGGWFWWGAKGPEPFKLLWRLLFNRLTVHHGLHNLIWVLTSEDPDWYPGDDVVDVLGVDAYPDDRRDALLSRWEALQTRFNGRKLVALTEFGGVPDIERMQHFGVWWAWFAPWTGTYGPSSMPTNTVARVYPSPGVLTLDELNAVAPRITDLARLPNNALQLTGTGPRGATHHVWISTNLDLPSPHWSPVSTGRFAGGVFTFTDPNMTRRPTAFYRASTP